jgi:hypothetical protein
VIHAYAIIIILLLMLLIRLQHVHVSGTYKIGNVHTQMLKALFRQQKEKKPCGCGEKSE